MSKLKIGIIIATLTCLTASIVFAQSFFSTDSSTDNNTAKKPSAEEMKNNVRELGKQNEAKLNQQVQDLLAKNPPPTLAPLPTGPIGSATDSKQAAPATTSPAENTPKDNSAATNDSASPSTPAEATAPAQAQAAPSQSYTGFQNSDAKKSDKNSQSDDGWNVKY